MHKCMRNHQSQIGRKEDKIVDGWERTETHMGVPYYANHKTERTSWDHPYWIKIIEGLKEYDSIKYAAYRTAMKIRQIQKSISLHQIELLTIRNAFEEAGYQCGSWEPIHCDDLLAILVQLFHDTKNSYKSIEDPQILADLTLNFIQNLYDVDRTGKVKVMSAKLILIILSSAKLIEKYRFCYQELHDPSTYISKRILSLFLDNLMQLPDFLHESSAFGRNTEPAMRSCCQMGNNDNSISEDTFYRWLQKEPQTVVWLPTFHRVATTESVKHDVRCGVCKATPIVGFRYKCLKCFNFDICQRCFFRGKTRKKHKLKHPIQEYCMNTTTKDNTAAFVKTLKNNLKRNLSGRSKPKYLPIEADNQNQSSNRARGMSLIESMMGLRPRQENLRPSHLELTEADIHSEISETARKIADLESNFDENEEVITPSHLDRMHDLVIPYDQTDKGDPSPESEGLRKQREEFYAIIRQLEEENRALYEQLAMMKETEDLESSFPLSSASDGLEGDSPHERQHISGNPTSPNYMYPPTYDQSQRYLPKIEVSDFNDSLSPVPSPVAEVVPRGLHLGDSVDNLDTNISRFSLPSPSKTHDFGEEEAELAAIVDRMGNRFPGDLSSVQHSSRYSDDDNEMLQAANSVGRAMSEFVSRAVKP